MVNLVESNIVCNETSPSSFLCRSVLKKPSPFYFDAGVHPIIRMTNWIKQWLKSRLIKLLGLDELQDRIRVLEDGMGQLIEGRPLFHDQFHKELNKHNQDHLYPLAQNIFTALENMTKSITTLNQRVTSYHNADIFHHIAAIYPKTRTVLFKGRSHFGDNIKYAFLAFHERAKKEGIACYFLPDTALQYEQLKAAGLSCLPYTPSNYTAEDIAIILSAKVTVLDEQFMLPNWRENILYALLLGTKTVQLWHGISLKKIGLEILAQPTTSHDSTLVEAFASCSAFDVFVAPAAKARPDWERRFSFHTYAPIGYPRNDVFFRDLSSHDMMNVDKDAFLQVQAYSKNGQPVIFYAPTFRDYEGRNWFMKTGIADFAAFCEAQGYLLYVNLHPGEQNSVEEFRQLYPRVNFIAARTDIYPVIKYADVLVTDYSSLAFDFLLLDRPLVFYRPDHAAYQAHSRQLIEDHERYVCGDTAYTLHELTQSVKAAIDRKASDPYREKRQSLRQELFDHQDDLAAQRVGDELVKLMG